MTVKDLSMSGCTSKDQMVNCLKKMAMVYADFATTGLLQLAVTKSTKK